MTDQRPLVVIAEDNPGLARVLALTFEKGGFATIIAQDGQAAWEAFQDHSIAAVVSDQEMPRMTGLDLCRTIRSIDAHVPFFLVTGRQLEIAGSGVEQELGIQRVFGKPFSPTAVIASVREAIAS